MTRGYFGVGLYHVKNTINVGAVLRAAGCFDAAFVASCGGRYKRVPTDTMKAYRRIPLLQVDDLKSVIPYDCVPVAVELVPGAVRLETYKHPERAFYVFGGEDQTLGKPVLEWCRDVVVVPAGCLNLAAAVNVVLYDRTAKQLVSGGQTAAPGEQSRKLRAV